MKNNFSLKFKVFDIFVVAFCTLCIIIGIIFSTITLSHKLDDDCVVKICYGNDVLLEIKK